MMSDDDRLAYRVIRSDRRTLAIQVLSGGEVVVRAPRRVSDRVIERFLEEKAAWIAKARAKAAYLPVSPFTEEEVRRLKASAKEVFVARVQYFAPLVGVSCGDITVRAQRTRWGSCSASGNLSFNCLLLLLPREVLDYVVVHELCHCKEHNHSAHFWAEVERVLPTYKESRRFLKEEGGAWIARLPK